MTITLSLLLGAACCGLGWLPARSEPQPTHAAFAAPVSAQDRALTAPLPGEPIAPLPPAPPLDAREVQLGRELFHDPRLSADNSVSCATCHDLRAGGMDRRAISVGIHQRRGHRNAPTVFNAGFNYRQFWDGRAATLEEQVDGPLQSPVEMGATWPETIDKLRQDPRRAAAFNRLYPEGVQPATVRRALAAFERSLVTPGARFDRYLRGDRSALNADEATGYRLFKSLGCASCHQGRNVGGGMMQPFGVMQSPRGVASAAAQTAPQTPSGARRGAEIQAFHEAEPGGAKREAANAGGRRNAKDGAKDGQSGAEGASATLYKVPSLRNVARTAPYFHDGSVDSLFDAVRIMSEAQLCRRLSDAETRQIVAFLNTLTGTYEGGPL